MPALKLVFEDFDVIGPVTGGNEPAPEWTRGYAEGYEAGIAAGQSAAAGQQEKLSAELVQAVADMTFSYAEAEQAILQSLHPLFEAISSQLFPGVSQIALAAHVTDLLLKTAKETKAGSLKILVASTDEAAIASALSSAAGNRATVCSDPTLQPGIVRWSLDQREGEIDMTGALESIATHLAALTGDPERTTKNG